MESEKPGIVSILAAATADSEKPRVLISAVRAVAAARADSFLLTRTLSGSFSSAGSVPIRAPLTVDEGDDDDDDSGSVIEEHSLASSEASRGLDSGTDDGFESISGDADDETELEDVIMGGVRVHRLLGEELGGETGDGSDFSGGSVIYRPFVGDVDEETSVNYSSLEEESENSDEFEGVSESEVSDADGGSMKAKVVIPRAILSLDDDEFDEILGSGDEEAVMLRVTKAPSDEEAEIGDRVLQFGDKGVVDEPECSDFVTGDVVSTEEEAVRMKFSDKLDNGLMSFGNIEESSLGVPPGGSNAFMPENEGNSIEASMELGQSFKQLIEKGDFQSTINKDNGGGNIHEFDALMKPSDAERVEDRAVELANMGVNDKPENLGSNIGELVSTEENMVLGKSSDDGLVSFKSSLGVVSGDCNEFLVESEGNAVDEDRGLDETVSSLVEQGVGQGSISNTRTYFGSACEADELMITGEGSIGSESRDSGDEDAENIIGDAKEHFENDCGAVSELEKPECEDEPEIDLSYESFQVTPTLDSVMMRNLEVAGGIDVFVSGCVSSDRKGEQESKNEENQESDDIVRKLSLPEDRASSVRSSSETANETVDIGEQINMQVNFQPDSIPNKISVGIEETSLLSVKDVERIMPDNSPVIAYGIFEDETQMARLNHNNTFMELDEHEGTSGKKEKLSESTFQDYSEVLSCNHSVELISEKVKERVEKTKLLKEKLQRIIRRTGRCSENLAVTKVVSKLSLAGGEHQTSLGLNYVSDGTKIMLPEQEFPDNLEFSINLLVIGKTGVGKSATVNSIFGETKSAVGAFGVTTKSPNYVVGNVGGLRISILDTPGLMSSATEGQFNQEVLMSIKKSMRKFPVNVILYIDRLDDIPDIRLLRIITSSLGSSIWQNAIVVLTHAASVVPDTLSYKDFIAQRSSLMHQSIRQAVPELSCVGHSKMPGIVLAENNMSSLSANKSSESTCRDWRLNLLILSCSVKIRSKAGSLEKQNTDVEKAGIFGSQLSYFTLFCSLWNVLLNSGQTSHSLDLEEKKRQLLDSYPKMIWDEQSQECLEEETLLIENQAPEDEERQHEKGKTNRGLEEGTVLSSVRSRRGRLGFQATKRFGIYLDTSDLHTGFSIGSQSCRKNEQEEGRILMRMRGSMSVLGLVPMLMSVFTSVYGGKDI